MGLRLRLLDGSDGEGLLLAIGQPALVFAIVSWWSGTALLLLDRKVFRALSAWMFTTTVVAPHKFI